jgi:hypothetical protein
MSEMDEFLYLEETDAIDLSHLSIVETASRLTIGLTSSREKAVSIFRFVRDEIKFGWTLMYSKMKASDVLAAKVGFANTKSTLFIALLRSAGIPARQVFVDISSDIYLGFGLGETPYHDHSYTEVYLHKRWIKVDAYIIDSALYNKAWRALDADERKVGYGVHISGTNEWDGRSDAFCQFVDNGTVLGLTQRSWGIHKDTFTFYEENKDAHNNFALFFPLNYVTWLYYSGPNSKVAALRDKTD